MANSDYTQVSSGAFCAIAVLAYPVSPLEPVLAVSEMLQPANSPFAVNSVILIGSEFALVTEVGAASLTVKRGCGDTIPKSHAAKTLIFLVSGGSAIYSREFLGTDTICVKPLSKTGAGRVPIEYVSPEQITFNLRYARPYPPAQVRTNGSPWYIGKYITPTTPLSITWVHRNRVLQADQILGHSDAGVTPEAGQTYRLVISTTGGTIVRTVNDITGTTFSYTIQDAATDFGLSPGTGEFEGRLTLMSMRDGLTSWSTYQTAFRVDRSLIPGTPASAMLLESGDRVLMENGSKVILE